MKDFQQNLLLGLAAGLCALCAYQWHSQATERTEFNQLNDLASQQRVAIQDDTNQINDLQHQVSQMDTSISELRRTVGSNDDTIRALRRDLNNLNSQNDELSNQAVQYQAAVALLQEKLKDAYTGISNQNDAIKLLTQQRDDFVKKYNDEVTDRNNIVDKYNDLAAQYQKLQTAPKP
jgi:chromosome segregation ATPase